MEIALNNKYLIPKKQLFFYLVFSAIFLSLIFINVSMAISFLLIMGFFPILKKKEFGIIEFLFIISLLLIFFRYVLLMYYDFSFVYIKFFSLNLDSLNYATWLSLSLIVLFSYCIFIFEKSNIPFKENVYKNIDLYKVNNLLTIMLTIKLCIFYFASISMGSAMSTTQKIIDMLIANLFLVDLLFLITFIYKRISIFNVVLFVLISVVTTSKAALFMLFLLYFISNSKSIKYYKLFNIKYFFYLILGIIIFIIVGTLSYVTRVGGEVNFIFLSIDPILGLFRRLGMIDNITAINLIDVSNIKYFSFFNLWLQFVLGFIPNSLIDFGYYGVSTGWALAHYALGQPDDIINAYETSVIGTALLFSHDNLLLAFLNVILIYTPILLVYYFSKDIVIKYYALFMFIIITLTGDIRVDALLIKHLVIYKFLILPLIKNQKREVI
jgi:hypothetical protein